MHLTITYLIVKLTDRVTVCLGTSVFILQSSLHWKKRASNCRVYKGQLHSSRCQM